MWTFPARAGDREDASAAPRHHHASRALTPTSPAPVPPPGRARGPATSPAALAAFLLCTAFLCPPAPLLAVAAGAWALRDIRRRPWRRGRTLARIAVGVGLVASLLWAGGAIWWNARVRTPLIQGPQRALDAGLGGDIEGFLAGFLVEPAPGARAEAAAFLDRVRERFGAPILLERRDEEPISAGPGLQAGRGLVPYWLILRDGRRVRAQAEFAVFDQGRFAGRFTWIAAWEEDGPPVAFPAAAAVRVAPEGRGGSGAGGAADGAGP